MFKRFIPFFLIPFFSLYANHFEAVRPILDLYDRPLSILSIGDNKLIHQIVEAYPTTCILADPNKIENLETHQIIHLNKKLSVSDLKDLNQREHFDLILACHSLHEFDLWQVAFHELCKLGDHLIVEISPENALEAQDNPAIFGIARYLLNLGLTIHLDTPEPNHFLWYCFKPKSVYPKLYFQSNNPGISLITYRKHKGIYPNEDWLQQQEKTLPLWKKLTKIWIRMNGKTVY